MGRLLFIKEERQVAELQNSVMDQLIVEIKFLILDQFGINPVTMETGFSPAM